MTARVLMTRLDSAGDVLLAGPAIRAVSQQAEVTLVCSSAGLPAARLLPDIRRHADLTLFLRINPEVQQERLLQRVGAARLKDFNARWIPLENAYFDAYHLPDESCVLVPQDVNAPVRP